MEWYYRKLEAADVQIKALQLGLKLHIRKLFALHVGDPDFSEKMAQSSAELLKATPREVIDALNANPIYAARTMSLNKAC